MATQTQYYNLDKPSYDEVADIEIINANFDKIDQQMRNNADGVNFAKSISSDAYDNSKSYAVGDYCIYDNKLYRCITAIESAEAFNIAKWEQTTVGKEVKQLNSNLDSEFSEIKGDLDEFSNCIVNAENVSVKILGSFGSGGLSNNIFNPNQKYRCSSTDILYSNFPIKCHVADGFRFGWVITNSNGTNFVGWRGWYASDVVIPKGIYFKLQIARVNEDTSETANVEEFTSAITLYTQFEKLNAVTKDIELLKHSDDTVFEQGSIITGSDYQSDNFIRTVGIVKGKRILINNTTNFSLHIVAYYYNNNGVFTESSPSELIVYSGDNVIFNPTSNNFRLRVQRGNASSITPTDVSGVFKSISTITYTNIDRDRNRTISLQYKDIMIGFAHRGASNLAPENTASAFKMAAEIGYIAIETDFRFTSDGVPVIIHDAQVDRTSNLNGNVSDMTLAQLKAGDFGSWFYSEFTGEKILTFEECIKLCKQLGLLVVMEQKQWLDADRIKQVCDIVKKYDMCDSVWWVGDTVSIIVQFANNIPNATIGYVVDDIPSEYEAKLDELKNASDKVYISMRNTKITEERASILRNKGIKLYAWTIDDESEILSLNPYVSGVFSNSLNAPVVLMNNYSN